MKTAIIKQMYDSQGPWSSVKWSDTTAEKIFEMWPSTITFWGITCLLKADWYIVPQQKLTSDYIQDVLKTPVRKEIMEKYTTGVVAIDDIPLNEYDLVFTLDPIFEIPQQQFSKGNQDKKPIFAYFVPEHWDRLYNASIAKPIGNFDLFLAVMLEPPQELTTLPQSVSFHYPCDPKAADFLKTANKKEAVWAEWRLLCTLGATRMWSASAKEAAKRLEDFIKIPVHYKGDFNKAPMGISDPPLWGDAVDYLKALGQCKYYLAVGRYSGPGQGIREAASLGCICIGEADKPYHNMVCHPEALCNDMVDMPNVLRRIIASRSLQQQILEYQYKALEQKFAKEPIDLLKKAITIKKQK